MKRSKLINNIVAILEEWENCEPDKQCAEQILEYLEQEGMSPPSYLKGRGDYGFFLKEGWEPENEEI